MTDTPKNTQAVAGESIQPTAADTVTDPTMVPMDDAAGGPTADKEERDAPIDDPVAAQLGDFA